MLNALWWELASVHHGAMDVFLFIFAINLHLPWLWAEKLILQIGKIMLQLVTDVICLKYLRCLASFIINLNIKSNLKYLKCNSKISVYMLWQCTLKLKTYLLNLFFQILKCIKLILKSQKIFSWNIIHQHLSV